MASALKGLRGFEGEFKIMEFLAGKTLAVMECSELRDHEDGKPGTVRGSKVTVVVLEDKTVYPSTGKNGQLITNKYAQLAVKIPGKMGLSIPVDTVVELVNPTAKVWGDYRNQLSITAEDVRPVAAAGSKH